MQQQQHVLSGWLLRAFAAGRPTFAIYNKELDSYGEASPDDFMASSMLTREMSRTPFRGLRAPPRRLHGSWLSG